MGKPPQLRSNLGIFIPLRPEAHETNADQRPNFFVPAVFEVRSPLAKPRGSLGVFGPAGPISLVRKEMLAYVGRLLTLAFLAPAVLERLLIERRAPAVSVKELGLAVDLPWLEQENAVFGLKV